MISENLCEQNHLVATYVFEKRLGFQRRSQNPGKRLRWRALLQQPLTIFTKLSILDVCENSGYIYGLYWNHAFFKTAAWTNQEQSIFLGPTITQVYLKQTPLLMFSCEFCENSQDTLFVEHT